MNVFIGNTLVFILWPLIWFYFSGIYYWTKGSAIKYCTAVSQKSVSFLEQRGICSCGFKHKHSIMISSSATERHKKGLTSNFLLNIIFPWQIQMAPWSCTFHFIINWSWFCLIAHTRFLSPSWSQAAKGFHPQTPSELFSCHLCHCYESLYKQKENEINFASWLQIQCDLVFITANTSLPWWTGYFIKLQVKTNLS